MKNNFRVIEALKLKPVGYLAALFVTAAIGLLCYPFREAIGYQTVGFLFLMSISVLSVFIDRGPVLIAAVLNFIVWNFFFIPPVLTFHISRLHDLIALFAYLGVALSSGSLITRIRKNQMVMAKSQGRIRIINALLGSLNNASSIKEVVQKTQEVMKKQFGAEIIVFLKEKEGPDLSRKAFGNTGLFSEEEFDMALPVYLNIPVVLSGLQYYPLSVHGVNIGVVGIQFSELRHQDEETLLLVRSFVAQLASALDREIKIDVAKERQINLESQKRFQNVLNSVLLELRTPIEIIQSATSILENESGAENKVTTAQVSAKLKTAEEKLNILVGNIHENL